MNDQVAEMSATYLVEAAQGAVIFNPVVQMAELKQPFYYARFPSLFLG
ncbi:hypothetical protein [Vreelandella indica]